MIELPPEFDSPWKPKETPRSEKSMSGNLAKAFNVVANDTIPPPTALMPDHLWKTLYAMRDGRITAIFSLEPRSERDKIRAATRQQDNCTHWEDKDIISNSYSYVSSSTNGNRSSEIRSWGDFVEFAVMRGLDLTGLTLSPEQKKFFHTTELRGKNLSNARMDNADLSGMDFSGTRFSGAQLNNANLNNSFGTKINFQRAKADKADFSGCRYTEPNFLGMESKGSTHFYSTYEKPKFQETEWANSRIVASRFYMESDSTQSYLNLGGGFVAASLFHGIQDRPCEVMLKFSRADLPGNCFSNVILRVDNSLTKKGDLSPLLLNDPRLRDEEREYLSRFGQWAGGSGKEDALKISPLLTLPLKEDVIYTTFSDARFEKLVKCDECQLSSAGPIVKRDGFSECALVDLDTVLPPELVKAKPKADPVVVEAVVPPPAAPAPPVVEEAFTFDEQQFQEQLETLKKASMADALSFGGALSREFARAVSMTTQYAMAIIGDRPALETELKELKNTIEECSVDALLAPPPSPPIEAEAPAPEPPPQKSSSFMGFMAAILLGVEEEAPPPPPETPPLPPPLSQDVEKKTENLRRGLGAMDIKVPAALAYCTAFISQVEQIKARHATIQEAVDHHVAGLTAIMPEFETDKPAIAKILKVTQTSMTMSLAPTLSQIAGDLDKVADASAATGSAFGLLANTTMPSLKAQFQRLAGFSELVIALKEKNMKVAELPGKLGPLYHIAVDAYNLSTPPLDQIQKAHNDLKQEMIAHVHVIQDVLRKNHAERTDALRQIISLS